VHVPAISLFVALSRLRRLLEQTPELRSKGRRSPFKTVWLQNVEGVLTDYFGPESWQLSQFKDIHFFPQVSYRNDPESKFAAYFLQGVETAEHYLRSRLSEMEEETQDTEKSLDRSNAERPVNSRKVFVVHGHDHGSKETVARFLAKLDLDPIILHEQADKGRTVIEKFEDYSDVQCAVVILSPDDIAYAKSDPAKQEERARQNVILELGYFIGRLGRDRTFALLLNGVSQPSDLGGILYISMSDGSWRMKLVRELKEAGIEVDANKAI